MIARRRITALVVVGVLGAFCGGVVPVIAQEDAGPANGVEGSAEPGRQAPAETQTTPTSTAEEAPPAAQEPAADQPAPEQPAAEEPAQQTTTAATPAPAPEVVPEAEGNSTSQDEPARETDSDDETEEHAHERAAGHALDHSDPAPDPELREPDGTPAETNPTFSWALPGPAPIGVPNFFIDKFRIPPFLLPIYQAAGMEYGVRWEILAAINEIETDYGRNLNVSSAGALGWMQFMPATWKAYGVDANRDRKKDPYNPVDAIFAAARYLKAAGAETDIRRAIFAYNHADWYVESVLMRAQVIGGMPADLVGSLTGLTQGHFPVHAEARYADDRRERVAQQGVRVFARTGSPVIAVQDGKIISIGYTKRLGRFMRLRDAYGNVYTYGRFGSVARVHRVPRRGASRPDTEPVVGIPSAEAAPEAVTKERLFANPQRPAAAAAGGKDQLALATVESDGNVLLKLRPRDVTTRPLKVGSKVVAGTILGRVGRTTKTRAAHLLFEIRPAGRGAPRIDPKPVLDGWKLLESTALYRAVGKNPFFGRDAKNPTIGQILLMSKEALVRHVLENRHIEVYGCGRRDIRAGIVDRRVLAMLAFLAAGGLEPTVTSLRCGHSYYTKGGSVSHHSSGNAADIAKINGIPIIGHQGPGSITDITVRRLLTLQGTMKPAQLITLMTYEGTDNTYAMGDHADHIHVGFRPEASRKLQAVLKPGQWTDLIDRLSQIDNPTVPTTPSDAAVPVQPTGAQTD